MSRSGRRSSGGGRMETLKKAGILLTRVVISLALLIFLLRQVDLRSLLGLMRRADKLLFAGAAGLYVVVYMLCFLRWKTLLKAAGIDLGLKQLIPPYAGGIFFNIFLPSSIGGDVVRSFDLAASTRRTPEVVASALVDRLSGYGGLVIVSILSLIAGTSMITERSVYVSVAVIAAVLAGLLLVLFNSYFYRKINAMLASPVTGSLRATLGSIHTHTHIFRHKKKAVGLSLLISLGVQLLSPLTSYLLCRSLGFDIGLIYFFVFVPIIGAVTMLPISIGGLGLRDALTVYFFAQAGLGRNAAFAMSLLGFFIMLVLAAVGGITYVFTLHHRRVQSRPAPGV